MVVEADPSASENLESLLLDQGYRVNRLASGEDAIDRLASGPWDLVILAVSLPRMSGLETLKALKEADGKLPVIVLAGTGSTDEAIQATKLGAFDYLLKPIHTGELLKLVKQALESGRLTRSPVRMDEDPLAAVSADALLGRSRPMQELFKAIGRVAPTDATVLIRGESGTGKELVARAVYQHSTRMDRPFVVVNCAAIPDNLLESELFGYEKGAFTGAAGRRIGKIEYAEGGTVFLDEVGDMPLGLQAKILRLLQEKRIERIGGHDPIAVDVRILAATNRDLEAAIEEKQFREDLYYRLNVVTLTLPPLRERADDILLLCDYFLNRMARNLSVRNPGLTPDARRYLTGYDWPGNVRELANAMEKCLIFSRGRPIGLDELGSLALGGLRNAGEAPGFADASVRRWTHQALAAGVDHLLNHITDHVARIVIGEALTLTGGNRSKASKYLGISRPSLLSKMDKFGLRDRFPVDMD
jgi:two-component system nitrogen regulation response regulator GlnG